ncbi:methyltransferase domain-containing protein [Sporosarcina sp. HYO08]|uniref:methyltransferase domain-containing protein n=1 Tax=Sporosarcina sp. HYO08 TaxID=1759557 RepID=UPI000796A0DD|nr:methyltransferase domain-containing protein [Sporosarcina sp. HYO08]KXH80878.1 hypothetical protein AU377_09100 [Sporosarcina sp. HYO08]
MMVSKKMKNARVIENNSPILSCPICSSDMDLLEYAKLVCLNNHSFDLSKNGYVNLAPQASGTKYDKSLFQARKIVMASGFFDPIISRITENIKVARNGEHSALLLDAGCGEGSHLSAICTRLNNLTGVGIDLAKEGIEAAAKMHPGSIWAVADLAKCPFGSGEFDFIVNILSPANFAEFTRVLKPGGMCLKVVPESGYLQELRTIFYDGKSDQANSADPIERFGAHFEEVETTRLTYQFPLTPELLEPLIRMTPLSWGAGEKKVKEALQTNIRQVTVDLSIISGLNG